MSFFKILYFFSNLKSSFILSSLWVPTHNEIVLIFLMHNDNAELMAVAKLAQPIQKRDDIDMNFVVRWDY